jgi:hypothetical protein
MLASTSLKRETTGPPLQEYLSRNSKIRYGCHDLEYHHIFNMTGATSGAGTSYPSSPTFFSWPHVAQS